MHINHRFLRLIDLDYQHVLIDLDWLHHYSRRWWVSIDQIDFIVARCFNAVKYWYLLTKTRYKGEVVRGLESRLEDDREKGIKVRVHRLRLKKCSGEIWLNSGGAKPFIY